MMISIITVVFNNKEGIKKTLHSLRNINSDEFQHIIIDGKSNDGTLDIIKKYEFTNKIVISESDKGIYHAMNKGISLATGNYIVFLNSGDTVTEDFFLVPKIIKKNKYDFYYSGLIFVGRNRRRSMPKVFENTSEYMQKMPFPHPGLFAKKSLFDELGSFDLSVRRTADHEWIVRMIKSGKKGKLIEKYLVEFALDGFSLSFYSILEMYKTARKYGRDIFKSTFYLVYGFVVVIYYKLFL